MPCDSKNDLLVITAAGGKQATHLIPHVVQQWQRVRLVVNSGTSAQRLQTAHPSAEVVAADLTEPSQCLRVLQGATATYHIGPSHHPRETEIGYNMVDAALAVSRSIHFVYSSVLNSGLRKLMNHDCKRYVEEYLIESGLDYTILSPTVFLDGFPISALLEQIQTHQELVVPVSWNPDTEFSFLALQDMALASAVVLNEREKHFLARYDLCGTTPRSYSSLCREASRILGRKVVPKQKRFEAAVDDRIEMVFGNQVHPKTRDAIERLFLYYNRHGIRGNSNTLTWLLGKQPTSSSDWMEAKLKLTNTS